MDFNNPDENNLKIIKDRLIKLKRKPVKRIMDSKNLEKIKNYPALIRGLKEKKYLIYSDMGSNNDFNDFFIDFVKKNSGKRDVSLIICVNPGRAAEFLNSAENLININEINAEDVPDIVIFDEVITETEIARLIYSTDYFISSKSYLDKNFKNYAIRLDKEIFDYSNFK